MISRSASSRAVKVLLIAPPFAAIEMPSLGLHSLQAVGRALGHEVSILYSNIQFASQVGISTYREVTSRKLTELISARLFGALAFGAESADQYGGQEPGITDLSEVCRNGVTLIFSELTELLKSKSFDVIGCTTTFDQTLAALAILNHVKWLRPDVITILGGANCEGDMATGLSAIAPAVDYIFSGESETSFTAFLERVAQGTALGPKVKQCIPVTDLDELPCPDYSDYFSEVAERLPQKFLDQIWISYETSRGCWWGEKHHCAFCGLNGAVMEFRAKSPVKVATELKLLSKYWAINKICTTDNIAWHKYHRDLFPMLATLEPAIELFFELKPTSRLHDLSRLNRAGVQRVQMGIETFSTRLLHLLSKGGSARQNILALRNAQICGIQVIWNLLYRIPNDEEADYKRMIDLIPAIVHLEPPRSTVAVSIDRFSPFFDRPTDYRITNIRPRSIYREVYPAHANLMKLAYHFDGDYPTCDELNPDISKTFLTKVGEWKDRWEEPARPVLTIIPFEEDFLVIDTRQCDNEVILSLTSEEARFALFCDGGSSGVRDFCVAHKLVIEVDGDLVPITVADRITTSKLNSASHSVGCGGI